MNAERGILINKVDKSRKRTIILFIIISLAFINCTFTNNNQKKPYIIVPNTYISAMPPNGSPVKTIPVEAKSAYVSQLSATRIAAPPTTVTTTTTTTTTTKRATKKTTKHTTQRTTQHNANISGGKTYIGRLKVTGYDGCPSCGGGGSASGRPLTLGRTIAMCSQYPFGTKIYISGLGTYVVEDRGVGSGVIDVFVRNHDEARQLTGYYDCYIIN